MIRVLSSLDPDQARHSVRLDLGPNFLQKLSADKTRSKEIKVKVWGYPPILINAFNICFLILQILHDNGCYIKNRN